MYSCSVCKCNKVFKMNHSTADLIFLDGKTIQVRWKCTLCGHPVWVTMSNDDFVKALASGL